MKSIRHLFLCSLLALAGCQIHDEVDVTVKRKAVVHLVHRYGDAAESLQQIESLRLLVYDSRGDLYRDTRFSREEILRDTGIMQTYLSDGYYTFIGWANAAARTTIIPGRLDEAVLAIADTGADRLMFGRCDTSVAKGDSLRFEIELFKSVFRIDVTVTGLERAPYPEDHYFAMTNRGSLSVDNRPVGELKRYTPPLRYADGTLTGSFYTPYFSRDDDFTIGVYCDNPASQYTTLCRTTIRKFADFVEAAIGRDVEIDVRIDIDDAGISIVIRDWEGRIIQQENLGY